MAKVKHNLTKQVKPNHNNKSKAMLYNFNMKFSIKEIGERIAEARNRKGITQEAVGDYCIEDKKSEGSNKKAAVSNWEKGKNLPSLPSLIKFSVLTGESLDHLIFGKKPAEVPNHPLPDDHTEILVQWKLLPAALQEQCLGFIKTQLILSKACPSLKSPSTLREYKKYLTWEFDREKEVAERKPQKISRNKAIK